MSSFLNDLKVALEKFNAKPYYHTSEMFTKTGKNGNNKGGIAEVGIDIKTNA